jgi:hypothetical protein
VLGFHVNDTLCGDVVCVPEPLNDCFKEESEALLTKAMLPGELPAAGGVKVTVYWALCPAGTLTGKLIPLTEYPEPLHNADETVTSAVEAESVPFNDELLPTATLPKFKVEGDTANAPVVGGGGWVLEPADTPAHPARTSTQTSARRVPRRRDRERFVLSIHTIIGRKTELVERAKSHDPKVQIRLHFSNTANYYQCDWMISFVLLF